MEYYKDLAEMYVGDDVSPDFYGWVFPKCATAPHSCSVACCVIASLCVHPPTLRALPVSETQAWDSVPDVQIVLALSVRTVAG